MDELDQDGDMERYGTGMLRGSRSPSVAASMHGKHKESATSEGSKAGTRKKITRYERKARVPDSTMNLIRSETSSVERPRTPQHSEKCPNDSDLSSVPANQTLGSAAPERKVLSTPKQRQLWDQLIGPDDRAIPMKKLDSKSPGKRHRLLELRQHRSNRSGRLVDALLPAPGSDPVLLDDIEEDSSKDLGEDGGRSGSEETILIPSSQPKNQLSSTSTGGPKVTYGQQRSFLSEVADSIDSLLSQPLDVETTPVGPSTRAIQQPLDNLSDEGEEANGAMRNVHELRAAGDSRRFNDEIDRLLVDIADSKKSALSRKRSALLELNTSLADDSFKTRLTNSGYLQQVFAPCRRRERSDYGQRRSRCHRFDAQTLGDGPCASHLHNIGLLRTLASTMDISRDLEAISKDRSTNMSKFAQSTVSGFEQVVKSAFPLADRGPQKLSPQLIALRALELLIRRLRSLGNEEMIIGPDCSRKSSDDTW